jgi:hypothetical protein
MQAAENQTPPPAGPAQESAPAPVEFEPWSSSGDSPAPVAAPAPEQTAPPQGDALELVVEVPSTDPEPLPDPGAPAGESEAGAWLRGARDLLDLDDFSGALELLDKILEKEPDHQDARQLRERAESQLLNMLSSKLGDLSQVPRVQMPEDEIIWLNYDHRAGFVLSLVDGELSYDEIISVSGLSQLECMRFLVQFLLEKVIRVD